MKVLIAEKASVAADIAAALKQVTLPSGELLVTPMLSNAKYERKIKDARKSGYFKGTNIHFTYAQGHLFVMKSPKEIAPNLNTWDLANLPFHMENMPLKPAGEGTPFEKSNKAQFAVIKKLFNDKSVDEIIVATDAAREGEHIFRTIFQETKSKKKCTRMWIKDQTEQGLLDAFNNRKSSKEYDGLANAAKLRAESDYLVGMNLSGAMTAKFGGFKNTLSIGRVQTPTLGILVERELAIRNFVPEDYFTIKSTFTVPGTSDSYEGSWFKGREDRFSKKSDADAVMATILGKQGSVIECETKRSKEYAPKLLNLTDLQTICGKKFGYTSKKTLDIAQSLYNTHKVMTYPRTSARFISTGTEQRSGALLKALSGSFPFVDKAIANSYQISKSHVNNAKVTDHEALTPTAKKCDWNKLTQEERNVFEVVVKRFAAAFYPECVWDNTNVVTEVNGETFKSSGKMVVSLGWREVEGLPNSATLPTLSKGLAVNSNPKMDAKQTQPPSRYSEAELVTTMENAGKFIADPKLKSLIKEAGIGTVATRAAIIEELIKRGYVERAGKSLKPTDSKGLPLFEVLPVESLKRPDMTAVWEQRLIDVEEGKLSMAQYRNDLKEEIEGMINSIKAAKSTAPTMTSPTSGATSTGTPNNAYGVMGPEVIAKCSCGGDILENQKAYSCSEWRNGCKNAIWKSSLEKLGKKKITKTEAKQLFTKGKTSKKVKFVSARTGKDYQAFVGYSNNRVDVLFNSN